MFLSTDRKIEKMKKILYIAFACNPYVGSEAQCGWSWPINMRNYAEVSIVTRKENKNDIEKYFEANNISNIKVYYHDIPDSINLYYKFGKMYLVYYYLWQKTIYRLIKTLHYKNNYDYIHHVTLGDFRLISPAWKLNTKFIFGPVGGAQLTPKSLAEYAKKDWREEYKRKIINKFVVSLPNYRKAINKAFLVLAANEETREVISNKIKKQEKCILLTENGINSSQIKKTYTKKINKQVVLLWSGRIVNRKGLYFLIDVLEKLKCKNEFVLKIVGDGPEKEFLKDKVKKLRMENKVQFIGKVTYEKMQEIYSTSDIFVFPSLRETTGTVLFEAMVNRLPIVTFNQNGAALLIDDKCGYKIDVMQPIEKIKIDFADRLKNLIDNPSITIKMGEAAYKRVIENYEWGEKCKKFYEMYIK